MFRQNSKIINQSTAKTLHLYIFASKAFANAYSFISLLVGT